MIGDLVIVTSKRRAVTLGVLCQGVVHVLDRAVRGDRGP